MLIDWFTVIAQIVNFMVLVWLLKRFLYGRILRAVDKRESSIAAQIADAKAREAQAQEQLVRQQAELEELDRKREAVLAEARADAERLRAQMIEQARDDVRKLETKWQQDLEHGRQAFLLDLRTRASAEILAITRRVVADLTSRDLEQCAVQVVLEKIRSLDREVWSRFGGAELVIRSSAGLADQERSQIAAAVEERIGRPVRLQFETAADVGLGLELRGNGWRIGWSSESYLQALEQDLTDAFAHAGSERLP